MRRFLTITVKPHAKRAGVETLPDGSFRVMVAASPIDGKANAAVIAALAEHLRIPKSRLAIIRGERGKQKWIEVLPQ